MNIDRTDPTILMNYIKFPDAVRPTNWMQTAAKATMIAVHILLSIVSFGYFPDIRQNAIVPVPLPIPVAPAPPPVLPPPPPLVAPPPVIEAPPPAPPKPIQVELIDISNDDGMKILLGRIRQGNKIYFKCEDELLSIVTKDQFDALDKNQKEAVVNRLITVIEKVSANDYLNDEYAREKNALRTIRNEIHLSLNPAEDGFSIFPRDVLEQLILGRTSPQQVEEARQLNKKIQAAATDRAKIKSINNGLLRLREALPPKITTATQAIEWLEKNTACDDLRFANFIGFDDFSIAHLERLTQICPDLTELRIRTDNIVRLGNLPASLRKFYCWGCKNLAMITMLPSSLRELECTDCPSLFMLPAQLPSSLIRLFCRSTVLNELPQLPENLEVLSCNGCHRLKKLPELLRLPLKVLECNLCVLLTELPQLPPSLIELQAQLCRSLTKLPHDLPPSLAVLNCFCCKTLTEVPHLPDSLIKYDFTECPALKLPENQPLSRVPNNQAENVAKQIFRVKYI